MSDESYGDSRLALIRSLYNKNKPYWVYNSYLYEHISASSRECEKNMHTIVVY